MRNLQSSQQSKFAHGNPTKYLVTLTEPSRNKILCTVLQYYTINTDDAVNDAIKDAR